MPDPVPCPECHSRHTSFRPKHAGAHQTAYCPELLAVAKLGPADDLMPISRECNELTSIFVTIIKNSKTDQP